MNQKVELNNVSLLKDKLVYISNSVYPHFKRNTLVSYDSKFCLMQQGVTW